MSEKTTRTVSLSPENDEYLAALDNASAKVNDLVTQLREGGDKATAVLDMQIEQKKRELQEAEQRVERLERGLEDLQKLRDEMESMERAELEDAREALAGTPKDPTNEAVQHWAEKLGMTPPELLEAL